MARQRSAWIAARARNASRQGGRIAAMGSIGVLITLLALVLVPRELDKQLQRRLDALPPAPDSLPLAAELDTLRRELRAVQQDTLVIPTVARSTVAPSPSAPDSAVVDLMSRLTRARNAPLPDSYRALAESPLLREDARVSALVDSIDLVDREREAHAALGGPGARYAALTARLTALGQRVARIAEERVSHRVITALTAHAAAASTTANATPRDSAVRHDSVSVGEHVATDAERAAHDAARLARIDTLSRRIQRVDSLLIALRSDIGRLARERAMLAQRFSAALPPTAMVLAALVIGLAAGFAAVLAREMRRPTVGDLAEVEGITTASVVLHEPTYRDATAVPVRADRRVRERPGVPAIIDRSSDTFVLLHQALTGVGDIVTYTDVVADNKAVSAAVALSVAAVAARESRAALVVESSGETPSLGSLLAMSPRVSLGDVHAGRTSAEEAVHVIQLDRDAHIDVLIAPTDPVAGHRRGAPKAVSATDHAVDVLHGWDERYDLRLDLVDARAMSVTPARDLVICVRQGATSLRWLAHVLRAAGARQQRVRSVIVWSRDTPIPA